MRFKIKNSLTWLLIAFILFIMWRGVRQLGGIDHNQGIAFLISGGVVLSVLLSIAWYRKKL